MKDEKKINREKGAGMILLSRFGLNPDSPIVDFNRERPDYTFIINDRMIGVEITNCLPSEFLSNGEINFERAYNHISLILADCEKWVNTLNLPGGFEINVTMFDNVKNMLSTKKSNTQIIHDATLKEFKNVKSIIQDLAPKRSISRNLDGNMISQISIYRCDYLKGIKVLRGPLGGFAKRLEPQMIADRLRDKEQKLSEYKNINNSINEYWLQIHIPYSEIYDVNSLNGLHVNSNYDQVYVTDSGGGCCRIK